jgi:hypothetical protein
MIAIDKKGNLIPDAPQLSITAAFKDINSAGVSSWTEADAENRTNGVAVVDNSGSQFGILAFDFSGWLEHGYKMASADEQEAGINALIAKRNSATGDDFGNNDLGMFNSDHGWFKNKTLNLADNWYTPSGLVDYSQTNNLQDKTQSNSSLLYNFYYVLIPDTQKANVKVIDDSTGETVYNKDLTGDTNTTLSDQDASQLESDIQALVGNDHFVVSSDLPAGNKIKFDDDTQNDQYFVVHINKKKSDTGSDTDGGDNYDLPALLVIKYVDGETVKTDTVAGKAGDQVTLTFTLPDGYELAPGQTLPSTSYTFTGSDDPIIIKVQKNNLTPLVPPTTPTTPTNPADDNSGKTKPTDDSVKSTPTDSKESKANKESKPTYSKRGYLSYSRQNRAIRENTLRHSTKNKQTLPQTGSKQAKNGLGYALVALADVLLLPAVFKKRRNK